MEATGSARAQGRTGQHVAIAARPMTSGAAQDAPPPPGASSHPSSRRHSIDPSAVQPELVLGADELELLRRKFALVNPNANKTRALAAAHALRLFRDDFPTMSEWELQALFQTCDLNCDGQLSLAEYVQTRAFHRLTVEARNENEVARSFAILDTDSDGVVLAEDVLALVEQARQPSARLLKLAIAQAATATRDAERGHATRGQITLEHFAATIRDVNRKMEQEIAAKTLRALALDVKRLEIQTALQAPSLSTLHRATLAPKLQATRIELDVLKHEVARAKRELITDDASSSALAKVCEALVATYENEQHVYECLSNLITYCSLKDAALFRYKLQQSGRDVNVLDSVLLSVPPHVKNSPAYAQMTDMSLHVSAATGTPSAGASVAPTATAHHHHHEHAGRSTPHTRAATLEPSLPSPRTPRADVTTPIDRYEQLKLNSTLRKQFVFYAMIGDVTNVHTMTRTSFAKFVKDCGLHELPGAPSPLRDADIGNIYAIATQQQQQALAPHSSSLLPPPSQHGTSKANMTFPQWLVACDLLLQRAHTADAAAQSTTAPTILSPDELEALMKAHVVANAKSIHTQNIAPDVSLTHVLKLLREYMWQFKQIFCQFGAQSLLEVDSQVTLDLKEFLNFARAFHIIRASMERDGEPYTPPPLSESPVIQPISLMELMREFYAAKLDISFSNPARRDAHDLNFREFLRCLQRIALAMHAHNPHKRAFIPPNGIFTTTFEALKEDTERKPQRVNTPLYQRRGNMLGAATSPTKNCKMTSTSIISRLLHSSRAMAERQQAAADIKPIRSRREEDETNRDDGDDGDDDGDKHVATTSRLRQRSPTKIFYGNDVKAAAIPSPPRQSFMPNESPRARSMLWPCTSRPETGERTPTVSVSSPMRPPDVLVASPRTPRSPLTPRRRPVTCGGPPTVRVIRPPDP